MARNIPYERALAYRYPNLAKEWDYKRNKGLTPETVTAGSGRRVYWVCSRCGHGWKVSISNRTNNGTGCPECNKPWSKVPFKKSLAYQYPEIAKEWDYEKNGSLTPEKVRVRSNRKVYWICSICGHSWKTYIFNRTARNDGCPECSKGYKESFPEKCVLYYIRKYFPGADKFQFPSVRYELDIYIKDLDCAIEYDGRAFHQDLQHDIKKDRYLSEKMPNTTLIRVREPGCPDYQSPNPNVHFIHLSDIDEESLEKAISNIFAFLNQTYSPGVRPDVNINRDRSEIFELMAHDKLKTSLQTEYPELASEWHPTRNGTLKPSHVAPRSGLRVWWKCEHGYEWSAVIDDRAKGKTGCWKCRYERKYGHLFPIIQELLDEGKTLKEISRKVNLSYFTIRNFINKGFLVDKSGRFKGRDQPPFEAFDSRVKKVLQFSLDGKFLNEYDNAQIEGFVPNSITRACAGNYGVTKCHKYKGYLWFYEVTLPEPLKKEYEKYKRAKAENTDEHESLTA